MDTLTHALSGALLARATAGQSVPARAIPRRVAAGFFACAFPDLDFVVGVLGPVPYLLHHRGVTHSLLMLPLWALGVSWLLAKLLREPGGWRAFYGVTVLALGAHIAGDLITSFGTMIFAPLSDWRAAIGTTFIIDLWFSGIILAGLLASIVWRRSRAPAALAGAVLAAYVGLQWVQRGQALAFGHEYAARHAIQGARVTVHPRPVSPFNWTVSVSDADAHHVAHVNLRRSEARRTEPEDGFLARLDAAYLPLTDARWEVRTRYGDSPQLRALVRDAWTSPGLAFYRWFADLPAFDGVTAGSTCVWFTDLRFMTPGRAAVPFRYGACRDGPQDRWRPYQRIGAQDRVALD